MAKVTCGLTIMAATIQRTANGLLAQSNREISDRAVLDAGSIDTFDVTSHVYKHVVSFFLEFYLKSDYGSVVVTKCPKRERCGLKRERGARLA